MTVPSLAQQQHDLAVAQPRSWTLDESMDGWWSLRVDGRYPHWSSVEGDADAWLAIAAAIESGGHTSQGRCAVQAEARAVVLWSPRNCTGNSDRSILTPAEAAALARTIRETVQERGSR